MFTNDENYSEMRKKIMTYEDGHMWEVRVGECQCRDVGDEVVGQCRLIFTNEIRNMITS